MTEQEQIDRETRILEVRLGHIQSYHDHKENMAHAALLVALAIAGFVLTTKDWPPNWVHPIYISKQCVTLLGVAVIWLMIHGYMRWQLRKRRAAAQRIACLLIILQRWATKSPSIQDLSMDITTASRATSPSCTTYLIDFFFPWEKATVDMDGVAQLYPKAVQEFLPKPTTAALSGERIVTLASLLIFVLIAVGTLLRP